MDECDMILLDLIYMISFSTVHQWDFSGDPCGLYPEHTCVISDGVFQYPRVDNLIDYKIIQNWHRTFFTSAILTSDQIFGYWETEVLREHHSNIRSLLTFSYARSQISSPDLWQGLRIMISDLVRELGFLDSPLVLESFSVSFLEINFCSINKAYKWYLIFQIIMQKLSKIDFPKSQDMLRIICQGNYFLSFF